MQRKIFYENEVISTSELKAYSDDLKSAEEKLQNKTGPGKDFLGWLNLPKKITEPELDDIISKADYLRSKADILICIGIGGSYLGAKAGIEFLSPSFDNLRKSKVLFAGHNLNSDYMSDLFKLIKDKEVAVNVISKSGTTTEPGVAFIIFKEWMEKRYGRKEAAKRIIATTDERKGLLRKVSNSEGYKTFIIPDNIGGRFSVLTPVGLFPMSFAGLNIKKIIAGAKYAMSFCSNASFKNNLSAQYAIARNILFRSGKAIEVMAGFQPCMHFIGEWWKQLAGESEGKNFTGIFPSVVDYTTDLHSLGQWLQEGMRNIFETFMIIKNTLHTVQVPYHDMNKFDYLVGNTLENINNNAYKGTFLAHLDGGVPVSTISLEDRSEETLGQLFYFLEKAIALSGYLLRVNPFNQPGVEAYKNNMFALFSEANEKASQSSPKES
ncbi:Glucose-6-phosphate isomerase [Candidatus Magnetomoraceae bacterium gMMP-15]